MARTFGVNTASGRSAIQANENANPLARQESFVRDLGNITGYVSEPVDSLDMDVIEIEGDLPSPTMPQMQTMSSRPEVGEVPSPGITAPMEPSSGDEVYNLLAKRFDEADKKAEANRQAQAAAEIMDLATGLTNSYFKHEAVVNQNNFNIYQAERQVFAVRNQAAFASLREQIKAGSRKDSAKLDAVARGQSSQGDVAGIAENNEEMYLAMNLMGIELSAARSILGLRQDIIQMEASNDISRYQRNADMVTQVASSAIRLGAM